MELKKITAKMLVLTLAISQLVMPERVEAKSIGRESINYSEYAEVKKINEKRLLEQCGIDMSTIIDVDKNEGKNEYIVNFGGMKEKICVEEVGGNFISFTADNGTIKNNIEYKDGELIIDGNKIKVTTVKNENVKMDASICAVVYKGTKSLKPYGSLKASDYNKYLASGKQNIQLGKALDGLTATALASCLSLINTYTGYAGTLTSVAIAIKDVLVNVSPKTEVLGCQYTTYTCGAYDYKYVNKFYANSEYNGTYTTQLSYEHFIVY